MALDIKDARSLPLVDRLQQLLDGGYQVRVYLKNQARLNGEVVGLIHDQDKKLCGFSLNNPQSPGVTDVLLHGVVSIERV